MTWQLYKLSQVCIPTSTRDPQKNPDIHNGKNMGIKVESCTQCGNHVEIRNDVDFTHFLCSALGYESFQYGKIPEKCPLKQTTDIILKGENLND
jgi:hypothetical protein